MTARIRSIGWNQRYRSVLVACLLAWVAGHALVLNGLQISFSMFGWATILSLMVAWWVLGRCSVRAAVRVALPVVLLVLGVVHAQWQLTLYPQHHIHYQVASSAGSVSPVSEKVTFQAIAESVRPHPNDTRAQRAILQLVSVDGSPAKGRLKLWKTKVPLPPEGTLFEATGWIRSPNTAAYPGDFDERRMLRSEGISAVVSRVTNITVLTQPESQSGQFFSTIRHHLSGFQQQLTRLFYHRLPKAQGDMLAGVVLGSRAAPLDADICNQFARTGLIHFLAASGLNVGIVAGAVLLVMRWCRLPEMVSLPVAMLAVLGYGALADWAPSVVRASAMLLLALGFRWGFRWFKLSLSPLVLFCMALALLVAWQPALLDNLGFQLSLVTTFGIITMVPPLQQWLGRYLTVWGAGLVLVPVVAQLWVIPIIGSVFHQVAWHSVLLNIEAVACVTPLTILGFGLAFLGVVSALVMGSVPVAVLGWISLAAYPFATGLLQLAQWGNDWGAQWPALLWQPPHLPWLWVTFYYGVLCFGAWWLHHPNHHWVEKLSTLRQRLTVWGLLLTLCCAGLTAWLWWQHQQGFVAVLADSSPSGSWHVLAKQPGKPEVVGWVTGNVTPWKQRTLDSLAKNLVGGAAMPTVNVHSVTASQWQQWGDFRWQIPGGEPHKAGDVTLTLNDNICLFKATRAYNHARDCSVVWWGKPGRPGKLWLKEGFVAGTSKLRHPRFAMVRWRY